MPSPSQPLREAETLWGLRAPPNTLSFPGEKAKRSTVGGQLSRGVPSSTGPLATVSHAHLLWTKLRLCVS